MARYIDTTRLAVILLSTAGLLVAGCSRNRTESETTTRESATDTTRSAQVDAPDRAEADLEPTRGNTVRGTVTFEAASGGVRVKAELENLSPGEHGFHIHELGDCSAPDAASAGDHWNPLHHSHGGPGASSMERHMGDLGNIVAGPDGKATYDRVDSVLTLTGMNSIVGRSVIVHAGADDLTSQPSGGAGGRLACGVIRRMEGASPF